MTRTPRQLRADALHADLAQLILCMTAIQGRANRELRKPVHLRIKELTDAVCRLAPEDYRRYRVHSPGIHTPEREERRQLNRAIWDESQKAARSGDWSKVNEFIEQKVRRQAR